MSKSERFRGRWFKEWENEHGLYLRGNASNMPQEHHADTTRNYTIVSAE